jgi:hypothetical protein
MQSEAVQAALDRQVELEREIDRLCLAKFAGTCGACGGKCCRANHSALTVESWWLRNVSMRAHGKWWPDDWKSRTGCAAQGPAGCLLKAGRPTCCWSWLCEPLLAECIDLWQVIFHVFVSELPAELTRLTPTLDLLQLDQAGVAENLPLITQRLEEAHRVLAEAKTLIDPAASELDKHRTALHLLCLMPHLLHPLARQAMLDRIAGRRLDSFSGDTEDAQDKEKQV